MKKRNYAFGCCRFGTAGCHEGREVDRLAGIVLFVCSSSSLSRCQFYLATEEKIKNRKKERE